MWRKVLLTSQNTKGHFWASVPDAQKCPFVSFFCVFSWLHHLEDLNILYILHYIIIKYYKVVVDKLYILVSFKNIDKQDI